MNKSDISSILSTVDSIVNKNHTETEDLVAGLIMETMNTFETMFDVRLDEEQIDQLTDLAINHIITGKKINPVDLNEDTQTLMEKHEPQDVFLSLLEVAPAVAAGLRIAGSAAGAAIGNKIMSGTNQSSSGGQGQGLTGDSQAQERRERISGDGQETANPYSTYGMMSQEALARISDDSDLRYQGYMSEAVADPKKKHKKKVFKITFMDKGVKRRGTAVSHKGVMRIVSGKTWFKVYDENNRDVTTQFKSGGKK